MITQSFLRQMKEENKLFHKLDRMVIITYPFIFILGVYFLNRYITNIELCKENIITFAMVLALTLITFKASMLRRDVFSIEPLIMKEVELMSSGTKESFAYRKKHKTRFIYIEAIPATLLLLVPIIAINYPVNYFQNYFKETYILILIIYIFTFGLLRLIRFKNYINELITLYASLARSSDKETAEAELMKYDLRRDIAIIFLGSVFFITLGYLFLPDLKILHILLFDVSFYVLFILGKGLYDAYNGFYKFLSQIDESHVPPAEPEA